MVQHLPRKLWKPSPVLNISKACNGFSSQNWSSCEYSGAARLTDAVWNCCVEIRSHFLWPSGSRVVRVHDPVIPPLSLGAARPITFLQTAPDSCCLAQFFSISPHLSIWIAILCSWPHCGSQNDILFSMSVISSYLQGNSSYSMPMKRWLYPKAVKRRLIRGQRNSVDCLYRLWSLCSIAITLRLLLTIKSNCSWPRNLNNRRGYRPPLPITESIVSLLADSLIAYYYLTRWNNSPLCWPSTLLPPSPILTLLKPINPTSLSPSSVPFRGRRPDNTCNKSPSPLSMGVQSKVGISKEWVLDWGRAIILFDAGIDKEVNRNFCWWESGPVLVHCLHEILWHATDSKTEVSPTKKKMMQRLYLLSKAVFFVFFHLTGNTI